MKVYLDLDGVLTDFDRAVSNLVGRKLERGNDWENDPHIWAQINKSGEDFWIGMEWMPGARQLWHGLKKYSPTILSSPTRHESSRSGKRKWVKKELGEDVPIILEKDKDKYAAKDAILIDDRIKNIKRWEDAGGIGVLHKDVDSTLRKVEEIVAMKKKAFKFEPVKDPTNPERSVLVLRDRGGRATVVHSSKKSYKRHREKDWHKYIEASPVRVVLAFLTKEEGTFLEDMKKEAEKSVEMVRNVLSAYKELQNKNPDEAKKILPNVHELLDDITDKIILINRGDWRAMSEFDYKIKKLQTLFSRYPSVIQKRNKCAYEIDNFKFRTHPVVIDPYDAIVQQAIQQMGPAGKNIDVVKLEPSCPGKRVAWVTNEDFFYGKKDKKRVIHLCLNKIKDEFKKSHGKAFNMISSEDAKRMRDVIVSYLRDVVLPHEKAHIEQEVAGKGDFGPSPEVGAERAERWNMLNQMGIRKKAA